MKSEKWISGGVAVVLGFLLSFSGVGCLASAFSLDVDMGTLGMVCALVCLTGGACYLFRQGDAIVASILALVLGFLWRRGTLTSGFETLAYEISLRYDGGYGWGTIGRASGSVLTALALLGTAVALSTTRTICRRGAVTPVLTLALIPLMLCMVVTDTVPGGGYLACMILSMLLLILTQGSRKLDDHQANMLTAMVALPLILMVALLFRMFPQDSYVNHAEEWSEQLILWVTGLPERWKGEAEEDGKLSGTVDISVENVDLTQQGPRKQYTYAVMTVNAPTTGTLYLREQDFDGYTGQNWESTRSRKEMFAQNSDLDWTFAGNVEISTRRTKNNLFYPYYTGKGQFLLEGGHIANSDGTTVYSLAQYTLPGNWRNNLSTLPDKSVSGLSQYRKLPENTRIWAEGLLNSVLTDEATDTEIAQTIAQYVRSSATYDLNTPKMDEGYDDFARWFLTESDTGYCVHYATAAAVLLRAAGVEARYVTGYMAEVRAGEDTVVTEAQAHAWVEYYESRLGLWVVLEATPGAGNIGQPETEDSQSTESTDASTSETTRQTEPGQTTPDTTPEEETTPVSQTPERKPISPHWLWLLLPVGLAGQIGIRRALRRRRMRSKAPNARALLLWQEATLLGRLLKTPVPAQLEALAQKAKYSQHTLTPPELMVLEGWIREAKRRFREKPWYWKLLMETLYAI